jgi:hypothetical protein
MPGRLVDKSLVEVFAGKYGMIAVDNNFQAGGIR